MEQDNFVLSTGMKAYLIDSLVEHEKVDEAWNALKSYVEQEPDFNLHSGKVLKLASLLVKNERYDGKSKLRRIQKM